jgi:hypothetical protein
MAVPSFMADLSLGQAGWSGGFVDSWNRILAIGQARPALGPRGADMRLRPAGAAGRAGPAAGQRPVRLNQSFIVFFNVWATNPA